MIVVYHLLLYPIRTRIQCHVAYNNCKNVCKLSSSVTFNFVAQRGRRHTVRTLPQTGCTCVSRRRSQTTARCDVRTVARSPWTSAPAAYKPPPRWPRQCWLGTMRCRCPGWLKSYTISKSYIATRSILCPLVFDIFEYTLQWLSEPVQLQQLNLVA